ncbi:MAG: response regulator [Gammaproteobacteria bacterium]|nr:response regulator [Gammaproteobacteria bacterium]MCF6229416.1 response regulator [Gammaproteobacteria bacterium]
MSDKAPTVFIIEDDPALMELNALHIAMEGYEVLRAENAEEALALMQQPALSADLIVSDIVMPGMDGYALCTEVHKLPTWQEVPFIFVSSLSTLEERLKGYEVGGDDYITKPIDPKELVQKIARVLDVRNKNHQLKEQITQTQSVAMQAMTYSSDLGQVIEFFKHSVSCESYASIAELFFEFMRNNGLHSSIQFHTPHGQLNFGDQGEVSPLEANVIEMSRKKSRFFDFGSRTIINYQDFSILIKNMPIDDPDKYGIYKDTIGTLCNAIEARVTVIMNDDKNRKRQALVDAIQDAMRELKQTMAEMQKDNMAVIETMVNDVDNAMMVLGLTDEEENRIREIAMKTTDAIEAVFGRVVFIEAQFDTVKARLDDVFND